jgi:hypothetical protein
VYRAYKTMTRRLPGDLWTYTAPWFEESRDYGSLTCEIIEEHYRGGQEKLICLHAISVDNKSRWFAVNVDQHGNDGPVQTAENLKAALGWYEDLRCLGFQPLLMDANGVGGYHLLVCLAGAVPTRVVHDFVHDLVQNYAEYGLRQAPDVYPGEPEVNPHRPYGSYWRLPGHHHTRDYWTRVWNGERWLEREEAIEDDPGNAWRFARLTSWLRGRITEADARHRWPRDFDYKINLCGEAEKPIGTARPAI